MKVAEGTHTNDYVILQQTNSSQHAHVVLQLEARKADNVTWTNILNVVTINLLTLL